MFLKVDSYVINEICPENRQKKAEPPAVTFPSFVLFSENRPTKDYSCKIPDRNSNSKCHLPIEYEMVALPPPPFLKLLKNRANMMDIFL